MNFLRINYALIIGCLFSLLSGVSVAFGQSNGLSSVLDYKQVDNVNSKIARIRQTQNYRDTEFALVVGFTNPNEKLWVTKDSVINGNVLIMNHAEVKSSKGVKLTINGLILLIDSSSMLAVESDFVLNGDMIIANNSRFDLSGGSFHINMDYRYQYSVIALGSALLQITDCRVGFGKGAWTGTFTGHSVLHFENDSFEQTVTMLMKNQTQLKLVNVSRAWEFLLADSVQVNIAHSNDLILWFYCHQQQDVSFHFPQGIWIDQFRLNNTQPGRQDVGYQVAIDSTANVNWGILQESNSSVTLENSYMRTYGLIEDHGGEDTLSGFYNKSFYGNQSFKTSTQQIHLKNTAVETWNFYAMNNSTVVVSGCIFGEALSFDKGTTVLFGSVCDGTGGYIGANDGTLMVFASELEAQMLNKGNSLVIVSESEIDMRWMDVIFTGSSIGAFLNSTRNDQIIALDTAFVLEMSLDSFRNKRAGEVVDISGTMMEYAGPVKLAKIREYSLGYASANDSLNRKSIASGLTNLVFRDNLFSWNTKGLVPGYYYIFMDAWINQDKDSIEVSRKVYLGRPNGNASLNSAHEIMVSHGNTLIILMPLADDGTTIEIYSLDGKKVFQTGISRGRSEISLSMLAPGIYLARLISGSDSYIQKICIDRH